jgi:hypothetical protein
MPRIRVFAQDYKIVSGLPIIETALSGMTSLPESGSYIDLSGYELVHILLHLGTINNADTVTFEPRVADSTTGTLDSIDSTLVFTPAITDDGYFAIWTIEVAKLPINHHFLSVLLGGTFTNGTYADVIYMLEPRRLPVTQTSTVLPTGHQFTWTG